MGVDNSFSSVEKILEGLCKFVQILIKEQAAKKCTGSEIEKI